MSGHSLLRNAWLVSLAVRGASVLITRGAPNYWRLWAVFYFLSGCALRVDDWVDPINSLKWFTPMWEMQQIFSLALLAFVVREAVRPVWAICYCSIVLGVVVGQDNAQTHHWPKSSVEIVMWLGGIAAIAMTFITAVMSTQKPSKHVFALSAFLLLYGILMIAGADDLRNPNLGVAWSILEIAAFSAWSVVFFRSKTFPA